MIVSFEGSDYAFDFDDLDVNQARKIKRELGLTLKKWQEGLEELDPDCLVGLYWLMLAQNGKAVDMHKVNFRLAEFGQAFAKAVEAEAENREEETPKARAPRAQK